MTPGIPDLLRHSDSAASQVRDDATLFHYSNAIAMDMDPKPVFKDDQERKYPRQYVVNSA